MSRYYREPAPPPSRWDSDRFTRERDYREVDEYYSPPPQRRAPPTRAPVYEDDRYYYEEDRYGPRGSRVERQYFEDEEYYDPRAPRGQVIPFRPAGGRPSWYDAPPPRPGQLIRRQSSLDTFDRPPARRYDDTEQYRPPPRPQRIDVSVPEPSSPRANRYRPARGPAPPRGYYEYERDYYDDVAIADPDYYGDDGFREYREREWSSRPRRRDSSESKSRAPEEVEEKKEEVKEEVKSTRGSTVRKEEIKEDFKEEIVEKPYPRRGKTKMPKRLVHTKVLFDLGYPFYEEGDKTIIIEKALGPDNIDEVFAKSREYREREVSTTRLIEAPPPAPKSTRAASVHESVHESVRESLREDLKQSEVRTKPLSEAPRAVREWDQLSVREDDRRTVQSSHRTRSRARSKSRRREESDDETDIRIERKSTVIEREPSPERERRRRRRRSKSARRRSSVSSVDETEIIKTRRVIEEDDFMPIESEELRVGPLVMARDIKRQSRSDREIREEIRRLEAESKSLRRERRESRNDDVEVVKIEQRRRSRSISPRGREIIIERRSRSPSVVRGEVLRPGEVIFEQRDVFEEQRGDDLVEVTRSRRDRSFSRTRAPSAGLVKAMMYAAT